MERKHPPTVCTGHTHLSPILEKWFSVSRRNLASKRHDCFHSCSQGLDWASSKGPAHGQLHGKLNSSFFPKPSPLTLRPRLQLSLKSTPLTQPQLSMVRFSGCKPPGGRRHPCCPPSHTTTPGYKYIKVEANPPYSQTFSALWQRQMHSNRPYVM